MGHTHIYTRHVSQSITIMFRHHKELQADGIYAHGTDVLLCSRPTYQRKLAMPWRVGTREPVNSVERFSDPKTFAAYIRL